MCRSRAAKWATRMAQMCRSQAIKWAMRSRHCKIAAEVRASRPSPRARRQDLRKKCGECLFARIADGDCQDHYATNPTPQVQQHGE